MKLFSSSLLVLMGLMCLAFGLIGALMSLFEAGEHATSAMDSAIAGLISMGLCLGPLSLRTWSVRKKMRAVMEQLANAFGFKEEAVGFNDLRPRTSQAMLNDSLGSVIRGIRQGSPLAAFMGGQAQRLDAISGRHERVEFIIGNRGAFRWGNDLFPFRALFQTVDDDGEPVGIPHEMSLRAEGIIDKINRLTGPGDVDTGDAAFDRRVFLTGPVAPSLAILTAATRAHIRNVAEHYPELIIGHGQVSIDLTQVPSLDEAKKVVAELSGLARILTLKEKNIATRLAENAEIDPIPEVAIRNFRTLVEHYPEQSESVAEHLANAPHAHPEVRLEATEKITKPVPALLDILSDQVTGARGDMQPTVIRRLAKRLGPYAQDHEVVSALLEHLICDEPVIRAAILELLLEHQPDRTIPVVLAHTDLFDSVTDRVLVAKLLGLDTQSRGQELLLRFVQEEHDEVATAAAQALGRTGDFTTIEPLHALVDRASGEFKWALTEAIARLQRGLDGAQAGQVSVSGERSTAGALSVEHASGGVSIEAEPEEEPEAH